MSIPKCTGPFSVGCIDVMTKANILPKAFDPVSLCSCDLGVFVRLYYPCHPSIANSKSKYQSATWIPKPNQKLYSYAFSKYRSMGDTVGWLIHMWTRNMSMDARSNVPLIDQPSWKNIQLCSSLKNNEKLPVVVFSHGLGGQRAIYSVFCTQLASEGYVVAAVEHRDGSATATFITDADGKELEIPYYPDTTKTIEEKKELLKLRNVQLDQRTNEVIATLDILDKLNESPEDLLNCIKDDYDINTFKGRIDTSSTLMMGHSFGGATTVNALRKEPRLKCGVALDVWFEPFTNKKEFFTPSKETDKPMLLINTEYFNWDSNMKRCYQLIKHTTKDFIELVTLKKTRHYDQCDVPGVIPTIDWIMKKRTAGVLPFNDAINAQRKLINDYFGKYFLKKGTTGPIKLLGNDYDLADVFFEGSNIKIDEDKIDDE